MSRLLSQETVPKPTRPFFVLRTQRQVGTSGTSIITENGSSLQVLVGLVSGQSLCFLFYRRERTDGFHFYVSKYGGTT